MHYITICSASCARTLLYWCAGLCDDAARKLTFGGGTTLSVDPTKDTKPSKPSLSVFTPPKKGDPAACVATGFFPNDVNISMSVGHGAPKVTASIDKAVLSMTDKTYNFAAFLTVDEGNDQEVTCKANEKIKKSIKNDKSADEPAPMSPALNCTTNGTSTDGVTIESIHLNFKSLTLQGLRVMFVKTVAFNFLMTVRALMF
ncbi:T cell receptor delta constant [Acipenser ruthenus]|uniref:T cell receptor delta constant n=1 Tax=Acipenser ruthenus TaxID=7906 RepID=UPI0027429A15|nr:T cell receptor delta constant [Acipenser ruthenus]